MPGYDPDKHPSPPWTWEPDPAWGDAGGYWKLDGSEGMADSSGGHSCDCVQYVLAKIQGRGPTRADEADPGKLAPLLLGIGYTPIDCELCGCGQGQCTDCVVIYSRDGRAFHAAAFDRELCDWGGKRNAAWGIIRYRRPGDYLRENDTMVCYCRRTPGPYISDVDLNERSPETFGMREPGLLEKVAQLPEAIGEAIRRQLRLALLGLVAAILRGVATALQRAVERLLERLRPW
jgi:hypothetical protein